MDIAELGFVADSSSLKTATSDLDKVTSAAKRTESATEKMEKQWAGMAKTLRNVLGVAAMIQAARQAGQLADAYSSLTSKLRNVTEGEKALTRVRANLFDISQRTRQEFSATAELYARMTRATKGLGLAESQRLQITETINKAAIVSGATAIESANAIRQLSQGLSAGALRGEEFNSVAEQLPILLDLVAKSTGRTRGELRAMAADGQITADVLVKALGDGAEDVDRQFQNMAVTLDGAMTMLSNSLMNFIGTADQSSQSSLAIAEAIMMVSQAIDMVAPHFNELVNSLRVQSVEQGNVTTSAIEIAHAMKVVVTGLLLAKSAVDVLIGGLKFLFQVAVSAASEIVGQFTTAGEAIQRIWEIMKDPGNIGSMGDKIAGVFSEVLAEAQTRLGRFAQTSLESSEQFGATWKKATNQASVAFEFLEKAAGPADLAIADTTAGIRTLGGAAVLSAEDIDRLAKANERLADMYGRVLGDIDPIMKAQEDYNKIERDAIALKNIIIKLGGNEATVTAKVSAIIAQAAKNRDRDVAAIRKQHGAADQLIADMETQLELAGMDEQARYSMIAAMQAEEEMQRAINAAREAGAVISEETEKAYIKNARALAEQTDEAEELSRILSQAAQDSGFTQLAREIDLVGEALRNALDQKKPVADLQAKLGNLRHQMAVGMVGAAQQVVGSVQSMSKEGSKAYKAMEIAGHALNVVLAISAILNQGKGDPWTAFARMAAMAAAVAGLVGSIGSFSGGASNTAEEIQAAQGTGTVLGDSEARSESIMNALDITADATSQLVGLNRGILIALHAIQSGIAGAAASIARLEFGDVSLAQGPAMNSMINPLGVSGTISGRIINSIFGGEQDLTDQGILIRGGAFGGVAANPNASAYQTIETDGGWFGSDRTSDQLSALGQSAITQIQLILESIGDAVLAGAVAIGLDAEEVAAAIAAFRIEEIRISTMDLTGDEAQQQLAAAFSAMFDDLAGDIVPFIGQFQRVGEGLGETLVRVATGVLVTREALLRLGFDLEETGPEAFAQMSESLIELVGGIEEFINGMQAFVDKFAPEAHKFELLQSDLTRALEQVGLTVPATRDEMWLLMQSLDATTEAGREQIAALLRLAGVADAYYTQLDRNADAAEREAEAAAEAAQEALDLAAALVSAQREMDALSVELLRGEWSGPIQSLIDLDSQYQEHVQTIRRLARESGRAEASQAELLMATRWYQRQLRALAAEIMESAMDLLGQLGYAGYQTDPTATELGGIDQVEAAVEDRYARELQLLQQLDEFVRGLNIGALSPLTPQERLSDAQSEYERILALAQGGDLEALSQLQGAAQAYLQEAQGFFGGVGAYPAIFEGVRDALAGLVAAGPQSTPTDPTQVIGGPVLVNPGDGFTSMNGHERALLTQQLVDHLAALSLALNTPILQLMEEMNIPLAQLAADLGADLQLLTGESVRVLAQLAADLGLPLGQMVQELGLNLPDLADGIRELANDLDINLSALTAETAMQLAGLAGALSTDLAVLTESLGIDLGRLVDINSPIFQALQQTIDTLSPEIRTQLAPLLDSITGAVTEADATAAVIAAEQAINAMPAGIRDLLAPYFEGVFPAGALSELSYLGSIDLAMFTLAGTAGRSEGLLYQMLQNIQEQNRALDLPSYAQGTPWVPTDGPAMLHAGEMVIPRSVADRIRSGDEGIGQPSDGAGYAEVVAELRALKQVVADRLGDVAVNTKVVADDVRNPKPQHSRGRL